MKSTLLSLTLFLTSACTEGQTTATKYTADGDVGVAERTLIFEHLKGFPEGTEVAFAFIEDGDVRYYGIVREGDSLRLSNNREKVFEMGSISKVFTSTLLANFVLEEKVDLDDDIGDYLEVPINGDARITFRSLANHTSGLPRLPSNLFVLGSPANPYKDYDDTKLESYLSEHLSLSPNAGVKSEYSNLGAGLLGYTLEKVARKEYQDLLEAYIFSKYGMVNSTTRREEVTDELVAGQNGWGQPTPNWDLASLVGAGGILSTVEDLAKFALAQFDESDHALALTREKTFSVNEDTDIGLGWHINHAEAGSRWHWHNGGTGGYRSCMVIDVERKRGVIILSNVSAFHNDSQKIDRLCFGLMRVE